MNDPRWRRDLARRVDPGDPLPDEWFEGAFGRQRRQMVERQLIGRDVRDRRVLAAMARVPRHRFVGPELEARAYEDSPLPIGLDQTISQPYMVARMTEIAAPAPGARVLEVGVGCGYQSAVLLELGVRLIGIEILEPLAREAEARLRALGYDNFEIHAADGRRGWPAGAPYDAIILAAAPTEIPAPLMAQLAEGGRLVAPAGPREDQQLHLITRRGDAFENRKLFPVRFVPMTGDEGGK